jgi:hypothetical protein
VRKSLQGGLPAQDGLVGWEASSQNGAQRSARWVLAKEIDVMQQPELAADAPLGRDDARTRDWFYLGMTGALVVLLLAGFAPTYYLRSQLGAPQADIPPHVHLHGAILTLWFAIALIQPLLVASGNTGLHRRIGIVGAGTALALVAITANLLVRAVPRLAAIGMPFENVSMLIAFDVFALIGFSVLVTTGILLRRNREAHKRLMLLASIAIIDPAVGRLPGVSEFPLLIVVGWLSLLAAVIVHDLARTRRIHRATALGALLLIGGHVAGFVVGTGPLGRALIEHLG